MEHKHTPGPWFVHESLGNAVAVIAKTRIASDSQPEADTRADARLIAAAPELVGELQHAHQIIRNALVVMTTSQKAAWAEMNERDGCDGEGTTRFHQRAAVLAKATKGPE